MKNKNILIIENFKAYKGQHEFDFSDINILTGANNSGKSTLIKALKLFSNGISRGDFPVLDLVTDDYNYGLFKDIINKDSKADDFKIGFYTKIGKVREPFKVMYSFGDGGEIVFGTKKNKALFKSVEIMNKNNQVLFGIYQRELFKVTKDNLEYDIDDPYLNELSKDYPNTEYANYNNLPVELPFKSPSQGSYAGLLIFKINIPLLKKYIKGISNNNYDELLDYFDQIKGKHGNWWGEVFNEENFSFLDYEIYDFKLNDFLNELLIEANLDFNKTTFFNFADTELKFSLMTDDDIEDEIKRYIKLIKRTNYKDFLQEVIFSFINSINKGLATFRSKSIVHFKNENLVDRLIPVNSSNAYILNLCTEDKEFSEFEEYSIEALKIFGFSKSTIEIINHLNSYVEINLVTIINNLEYRKYRFIKPDIFKENPRVNISDLGKGTANLIILIIKLFELIKEMKIEEGKKRVLGNKRARKTIVIEEPEAFLHPNWQTKLSELLVFIQKKSKFNINIIVETHSVYLIQGLQLMVAKHEIEKDKINILYFEKDKMPYKIHIRKDGILKESFGKGFYDETARLTSEILNHNSLN